MSSEEAPQKCLGPDYRNESEKPKATISKKVEYPNVTVLPQTPQLISLLTYVPSIEISFGYNLLPLDHHNPRTLDLLVSSILDAYHSPLIA